MINPDELGDAEDVRGLDVGAEGDIVGAVVPGVAAPVRRSSTIEVLVVGDAEDSRRSRSTQPACSLTGSRLMATRMVLSPAVAQHRSPADLE